MAAVTDQIHMKVCAIIADHRDGAAGIPPTRIVDLRLDLVALINETVEAALNETEEK